MTMSATPVARVRPSWLWHPALAGVARRTGSAQTPPAGDATGDQPGEPRAAPAGQPPPGRPDRPAPPLTGLPIPTDYVIGPDDVLGIVFWRDTDMSGDVTVRPDGMITLPLLRDIKAAGLTPDELREQIQKAAAKFIADPNVTVVVRQINSRNVFITGEVDAAGPVPGVAAR